MMKLLLLCLLSIGVFAGNTIKKETGTIKEYYPNGKVKSEISYRNDIIDGIRKEYYKTGKMTVQIPYKMGILDGVLKEYYRTGKLKYEIPFKKNILNGMFIEYYKTGKEKTETPFINGQKKGMGKIYNPTGKARKIFFKEGTYNGIIEIFSETNKRIIEITIKDGNVTKIL